MKTIIKALENKNRGIDVFDKRVFVLIIKELKVVFKSKLEFILKDGIMMPWII